MSTTLKRARRMVGAVKRRLSEPPEIASWRAACRLAEQTPRFTPGTIRMLDIDLCYADLRTFCPQWHDIFVRRALQFRSATDAPRILDCGANVGVASLFFQRAYPHATIRAYEADPIIFALLEANLEAARTSGVRAEHAAVWTSNQPVAFRREGGDAGAIDALAGVGPGSVTTVPAVRLRDVLDAEPWDLLKLDIEGAEDAVLADCEPVLHRARAIIMDLHELDPADRVAPRILERLSRTGFRYAIDDCVPLSWRDPLAAGDTPFPGRALTWAMTVRAWRT